MGSRPTQIVIKKPSIVMKPKGAPRADTTMPMSAILPSTYEPLPSEIATTPKPADKPLYFEFHCCYCSQVNPCGGATAGGPIQCRGCGNTLTVPPPPDIAVPAMAEQRFKFYCSFCGQKISAALESVGRASCCPTCKRDIIIPPPA